MPGTKKKSVSRASADTGGATTKTTLVRSSAIDPTETFAASIPRSLASRVRSSIPKGDVSRFVAESLEQGLRRRSQRAFVAEGERQTAPLTDDERARARRVLRA